MFDEILKKNDSGEYFPGWGTCLGYENMTSYTADIGNKILEKLEAHKVSLQIKFVKDPAQTKMWRMFGPAAREFETKAFTFNSHQWSIRPETFETDKGLASFWDVTSISETAEGVPFVASIESKKYPIMATQFHPEKPSEVWTDGLNINHSWESIQLQEMFSKEFVMMARQNTNTFGNYTEYQPFDISNFKSIDTGENMGLVYIF